MGDFWLLEMCFSKNPLGRTFLLKSSWIHGRLLLVLMGGLDLFSRKPNFTHTNSFPEVSFLPSHFLFFWGDMLMLQTKFHLHTSPPKNKHPPSFFPPLPCFCVQTAWISLKFAAIPVIPPELKKVF